MTITHRDVSPTLGTPAGCPPIEAREIDRVVRVLNAHCRCGLATREASIYDTPVTSAGAAVREVGGRARRKASE